MLQKLEGLKTTLWTGLAVALTFVLTLYLQPVWQANINLFEKMVYGVIAAGILFSAQFSRSRISILLTLFLVYYLIEQQFLPGKVWLAQEIQWFFLSGIFIVIYLALVKDRGLFSIYGILRLIGLLTCVLVAYGWQWFVAWFAEFETSYALLPVKLDQYTTTIPLYAIALFLLYKSLRRPNLMTASLLTNLVVANLLYQQQLSLPLVVLIFLIALQYILVVVVDSYYLAYRDELTNLPSRRALNQYALSLGRRYCVAMIDIDHFKKFNDTYGHDIGDQVLKLVAAKLAKIKKGGRVFRYGGEEFTAIFPRKLAKEAESELDHLRQTIADYNIVIRHPLRKTKKARQAKKLNEFKTVNVTISIGVATREAKDSFEQTVKQADLALYRAKKKGRNNVSY